MNRLSTIASADDTSHLQRALDGLTSRVDTFERNLDRAMESERVFRVNLETVANSMHSFVQTHTREDELLTRLIEEDTQRSREAKDEYDALAARFEESLRPHAADRRRQLFKTISLYVGIVLSVVFMAPLHLVVSLLEKLLFRLGYRRHDDTGAGYAHATARYRARQHWRLAANATRAQNGLRNRRRVAMASGGTRPGTASLSTSLRSTQGSTSVHSSPLSIGAISEAQMQAVYPDVPGSSPLEDTASLAESLAQMPEQMGRDGRTGVPQGAAHGEGGCEDWDEVEEPRDEADMFVDAMADARSVDGSTKSDGFDARNGSDGDIGSMDDRRESNGTEGHESDKKQDAHVRDEPPRPDWARPFDDDHSPPEMAKFPSADFWKISDDEMRIDLIDREDESSTVPS